MKKLVIILDRTITVVTAIAYIAVLVMFFIENKVSFIEAILVPGISFVLVSAFRHIYNAPRPYEVTGIPPMTGKNTKGKSMPSRHTFSIFIIAMTVFYYDYRLGIPMLVFGVVLAALRVIERVHFVKDVVVGAILGVGFGLIYYILP